MAIRRSVCSSQASKTTAHVDAAIAGVAARQHGVVSREQLLDLGLGYRAIDGRIARGSLQPLHRGVFAVGHRRLTQRGTWMAAVLAAGHGAVLSHRAAAALWGMRESARVEVTVPQQRRRPGITAHRAVLLADEVTRRAGIPVTNAARTLFDLAAVVSEEDLEHALNEAEIQRLTSPLSLDDLVARYPRRAGTKAVKRALHKYREIGEVVTKSHMERRFLAMLDAHAIPRPRTNEPLGPYLPDALWPAERLIVELDSYGIHTTRKTFEGDRARDRALITAGYTVIRISWRQLKHEQDVLAHQLRTLLTADPRPR